LLTVAALVAVGFLMHRIGKEFDVVIDNGTVSIDGANYEGMAYGTVLIDGDEKRAFDMWAGDRVIKKMVGAAHKLTIKILNEDDDSVIKTVDRDIALNFNTGAEMVSVSAIIEGAGNILTPNPRYKPEPVFDPDDPAAAPEIPGEGLIPGVDEAGGITP
jgi:hypothetical protein